MKITKFEQLEDRKEYLVNDEVKEILIYHHNDIVIVALSMENRENKILKIIANDIEGIFPGIEIKEIKPGKCWICDITLAAAIDTPFKDRGDFICEKCQDRIKKIDEEIR